MPRALASQPRSGLSTAPRAKHRRGRPAPAGRPAWKLGTAARVRWDRVGRLAMLCVLAALLYLYLSTGIHMFSTWGQARRDSASVVAMEREHTKLVRQNESLRRQGTLEGEARKLGMMNPGERQYVVSNLPKN